MFRTSTYPSSGGHNVLSQHLLSSLSVQYSTVCRMRADCSAVYCTESDDTRCCDNTLCPPEDGHIDVRNMSRIVM